LALFSNVGPCVDLAAPGVGIRGASNKVVDGQRELTGTSQAAPHVAGIAALVIADRPDLTAAEVSRLIIDSARGTLNGGFQNADSQGLSWLKIATLPSSLVRPILRSTVTLSPWLGGDISVLVTVESDNQVRVGVLDGTDREWWVRPDSTGVARLNFITTPASVEIVINGRLRHPSTGDGLGLFGATDQHPTGGLATYDLLSAPDGVMVRHLLWFDDISLLPKQLPDGARLISIDQTVSGPRHNQWLGSGWEPTH